MRVVRVFVRHLKLKISDPQDDGIKGCGILRSCVGLNDFSPVTYWLPATRLESAARVTPGCAPRTKAVILSGRPVASGYRVLVREGSRGERVQTKWSLMGSPVPARVHGLPRDPSQLCRSQRVSLRSLSRDPILRMTVSTGGILRSCNESLRRSSNSLPDFALLQIRTLL